MRLALLITGSRALARTAATRAWTERQLRRAIEPLAASSLVLSGRCPDGPDAWAVPIARACGLHVVGYDALDGIRYVDCEASGEWWRKWLPDWPRLSEHAQLLERDRALVCALVESRAKDYRTQALGLVAPWSETDGTAFMLGMAEGLHVTVERLDCPMGLGPEASGT